MAKVFKNNLNYFLVVLLIFSLMTVWLYSGWPQIWQKPAIPPSAGRSRAFGETQSAENSGSLTF